MGINAELFMGGDDSDWNHLRCVYRENTGYHRCGAGLFQRGSDPVHYNDGSHGVLDGTDGDCYKGRHDRKRCKNPETVCPILFPEVPEGHKAGEYITTNIIANFLGLGWAATPAGLKAMEELGKLNHGSTSASNAMCNFLILNISSLQLIPVNVIAFRSQYGSVEPTAIVGAGIVATTISTVTGIVFCKIMDRKKTGGCETLRVFLSKIFIQLSVGAMI